MGKTGRERRRGGAPNVAVIASGRAPEEPMAAEDMSVGRRQALRIGI
jgi:hypothetical protein